MDREEFQKILDKYNRGVANDEEKEIIRRFENHRKENNLDFWASWNTEEENKAKTDILSSISKGIADFEYNKKKRQVWWSAAASLLLVSTFAWLLLVNRRARPGSNPGFLHHKNSPERTKTYREVKRWVPRETKLGKLHYLPNRLYKIR